jgi:hypothetical protein
VRLFDGQTGGEATSFDFPRQARVGGVCLADFVRPLGPSGEPTDNLCLFVVTAGKGIRALADGFKEHGDFVKMHGVQALALETAEAYAELLHARIRSMWGTPDRPDLTMLERFRAEYPGKRYSFGYPACPRLEDQQQLFAVLQTEELGVSLTDGCMMEPEASVSALVFTTPTRSTSPSPKATPGRCHPSVRLFAPPRDATPASAACRTPRWSWGSDALASTCRTSQLPAKPRSDGPRGAGETLARDDRRRGGRDEIGSRETARWRNVIVSGHIKPE